MTVYVGDDTPNTYPGTPDPDTISGNGGNDELHGGDSADTIDGGEGDDELYGDDGNDTLTDGGFAAFDNDDLLDGGAGADTMQGGRGNDIYYLDDGGDLVIEAANEGTDSVFSSVTFSLAGQFAEDLTLTGSANIGGTGNSEYNRLIGNSGNNMLVGVLNGNPYGGYGDVLEGGAGDDTYYLATYFFEFEDPFNGTGDEVFESAGAGIDRVFTAGDLHLGQAGEIEFATLTGTESTHAEGSQYDNHITGNSGDNEVIGNGGDDTLIGGDGRDLLHGNDGNDRLYGGGDNDGLSGGNSNDLIDGGDGNDGLTGGNGFDRLFGGVGNDRIDGGAHDDEMRGGVGDDEYFVAQDGDRVFESANEGFDTVNSSITYSAAGQYIEKIRLTGNANINATGNSLANVLTGNNGINSLRGFAGNDVYYIQTVGDKVLESAGEGIDTVYSTFGPALLFDNVENLRLMGTGNIAANGNALANLLEGTSGHNILDGKGGADTMYGLAGNDSYYVDDLGDKAFEVNGEGLDQVFSSVTYNLAGQYIENLTLIGSAAINGSGNGLANVLTGNSGVNVLRGFGGDDSYHVQNVGDQVIEDAGGGTDTVFASVSYTIGTNVERLTLTGADHIAGVGNALDNIITGNSGDNGLEGGGGADTLAGGLGNDTYFVDGNDTITELAGEGNDTVSTGLGYDLVGSYVDNIFLTGSANVNAGGNSLGNVLTGNAGVNVLTGRAGNDVYHVQTAGDLAVEKNGEGIDTVLAEIGYNLSGQYIENLVLLGATGVYGTGNSLNNNLRGNDGANHLRGLAGSDDLFGGLGNDQLEGGAGADRFYFDTALGAGNVDWIDDFNAFDDAIYLDRAVFTALNADGQLSQAGFGIAGEPSAADARIIYDSATGALWYDADGSGAGAAIHFASVAAGLSLTYEDFIAYS